MSGGNGESGRSPPFQQPSHPRRALHGRRKGRRLRPGLKAVLANLLPRLRIELPTAGHVLDLQNLFARPPDQIWLEIGFGAGEHLAWQAARNPEVGFLGAEIFVNGVAALLRRIEAEGLENVRIYHGDARDLLAALPENTLSRVFILFADPWPKRRHHKRRFVQGSMLDRLADVMVDDAELRLATDDRGYLAWILELAASHPAFRWLARRPADWRERVADWPATRYELKAVDEGRAPGYLRFRRRPRILG